MTPSYSLGLVLIVIVAVLWAASSVLVQYLYEADDADKENRHADVNALALTFVGVALFALWLPFYLMTHDHATDREVHRHHFRIALQIAPVWFAANWAYNKSLQFTSITSSTVLASTGSLWTLLFAVCLHDEGWNVSKLVGVLLGVLGSLVTALHDQRDGTDDESSYSNSVWGDMLGLVSAIGYGAYAVQTRVLCPHGESANESANHHSSRPSFSMQLVLAYIGMLSIASIGPFAATALWHARDALPLLCLKGFFDNVISDYLWLHAVLLTSATVATVGLGLTIPLAIVSDLLWHRNTARVSTESIVGAVLVLVGFLLVNWTQEQENEREAHGEHLPVPTSDDDVASVPSDADFDDDEDDVQLDVL